MEEMLNHENKSSLATGAYELLQSLQGKHSPGSTTFYLRRDSYPDKRFLDLDLEKIRFLEEQGMLNVSDYSRQGAVDPNIIALSLLPKGQEVLKSRTITRTETTVQETFIDNEVPAWKANKKFRQFARTERGCAIVSSCLEAAASDVRSNIEALRTGNLGRDEWKARQIWLKYWLLHRYEDLPEPLRHEAEDFRDLAYTPRRKHVTK